MVENALTVKIKLPNASFYGRDGEIPLNPKPGHPWVSGVARSETKPVS
jgi:hypothetical protein